MPLSSANNSGAGKNDVVLSMEGVAKLSFSFLDEHHADSSLEPGEVKTPPQSPPSSKNIVTNPATQSSVMEDENITKKLLKTASQLEAAVCKTKISAILELDAINRRKEEAEARLKEKNQNSDEQLRKKKQDSDRDLRRKRKSRKKEFSSSLERHATNSDESTDRKHSNKDDKNNLRKKRYQKDRAHSYERRSDDGHDRSSSEERHRSRSKERSFHERPFYHPNHQFMGFRSMNPFCRPPRHDFHQHGRGGFYPRGRGGNMRGGMPRFHGFRHPGHHTNFHTQKQHIFFNQEQSPYSHRKDEWRNSQNSLSSESKAKIHWTKTKPSLSYAFRTEEPQKQHEQITQKDSENDQKSKSKSFKKEKKQREKERKDKKQEKANNKKLGKTHQDENPNRVEEIVDTTNQEVKNTEAKKVQRQEKLKSDAQSFDMFAESPPRNEEKEEEEDVQFEKNEEIQNEIPSFKVDNSDNVLHKDSGTENVSQMSTTPPPTITFKPPTRTAAARKEFSLYDSQLVPSNLREISNIQTRAEKTLSPICKQVELEYCAGISKTPPREDMVKLAVDEKKLELPARVNPFKDSIATKNSQIEKTALKQGTSKDFLQRSRSITREKDRSVGKTTNLIINKSQSPSNSSDHKMRRETRSKSRYSSHSEDSKSQRNVSRRMQSKSPRKYKGETFMKNQRIKKDFYSKNECKMIKGTKITKKAPLSFTAEEFLFPERAAEESENGSPDTDDYMDNWENDDMELNSNLPGESSTPKHFLKEESFRDDQESGARKDVFDKQLFVNPSPPPANFEDDIEEECLTPPPIVKAEPKDSEAKKNLQKQKTQNEGNSSDFSILPLKEEHKDTLKKIVLETEKRDQDLFGMQEIYDQFIRSVEESGIAMEVSSRTNESESLPNTPPLHITSKEIIKKNTSRQFSAREEISTSSASSSWSSTSSSSSSSSSTTTSSSDDSNDGQSLKKTTENSEEIGISNKSTETTSSPPPTEAAPTQKSVSKSVASKDLKKLNNLEANLARIQMMRANYDSADEISEELQKMENLFAQEKKIILQKYAKATTEAQTMSRTSETMTETTTGGQFVPSMQESSDPSTPKTDIDDETSKIFDANREAIRLTISPTKLPKTVSAVKIDKLKEKQKDDEVDFTEKLQKPPKEVAIVKPMMETNESRSNHRRSPDIDRSYRRRSTSRTRTRQRVRSISASPPRRGRFFSPGRRGNGIGAPSIQQYSSSMNHVRWRGSRRSRSRSRSDSRQQRRSDMSPPYRRRRRMDVISHRKSRSMHSRSRSHSLSPDISRERRRSRSTSYGRGYSRSPLPFKPPSPPMRQSMSPECRRLRRSHSLSRSISRSPPYSNSSTYDSGQRQYYSQEIVGGPSPSSSSYYYNVSPNRISLDARINIVLNGTNQDQAATIASSSNPYEGYNYSTYGYMTVPPQPGSHPMNYPINYANQYVSMNENPTAVYSNIPTIGTNSTNQPETVNYYYGEYGHRLPHSIQNQNTLFKELPKAVAVQKGNVLEIVPSELPSVANQTSATTAAVTPLLPVKFEPTDAATSQQKLKPPKVKKIRVISWKEEVSNRHVQAAVLRLSRENEGSSKGILRNIVPKQPDEKGRKKKVYFEDGIFPNRDSGDEDRRAVDAKIRRKLKQLRKRHGVKIIKENQENLEAPDTGSILEIDFKIDPELENAPAPPPPPGSPPAHLEQPIYLRPPTPTPFFYFHYDAVVHSMYVSQMETAIPPRLLNPKLVPPLSQTAASGISNASPAATPTSTGASSSIPAASPSATPPPSTSGSGGNGSGKKETTINNIPRLVRNDRSSPKLISTKIGPLRESPALKASPIETVVNTARHSLSPPTDTLSPRAFVSIGPSSQQVQVTARQSPIGFTTIRMGSFMRLPPSPLARATPPMTVVGVRHTFNVPPPNISNVAPHPQTLTNEIPQQFFHPNQHHQQQLHHHQQQHQVQQLPPPQLHQQHPHHPPPQFFIRGPQPPSMRSPLLPTPPSLSAIIPTAVAQHLIVSNPDGGTPPHPSPQAMVAPFNISRSAIQ